VQQHIHPGQRVLHPEPPPDLIGDPRQGPALIQVARGRRASLDLDTPFRGVLGWRTEPVTLRWILLHLTEETARHNGHLGILRELAAAPQGR
jgi:hypothetical protein